MQCLWNCSHPLWNNPLSENLEIEMTNVYLTLCLLTLKLPQKWGWYKLEPFIESGLHAECWNLGEEKQIRHSLGTGIVVCVRTWTEQSLQSIRTGQIDRCSRAGQWKQTGKQGELLKYLGWGNLRSRNQGWALDGFPFASQQI